MEVDGRTPGLTDAQHSAQSYEVTLGTWLKLCRPQPPHSEGRDNHLMCFSGPERGLHEMISLKLFAQCPALSMYSIR